MSVLTCIRVIPGHFEENPTMDSMPAVLSPSMTSGWNDPPNLGVASNRLAQLRRRPVDPSLSFGRSQETNSVY
uniref:Uncharacterized protein n=1 Tax=Angiostrongylus cantonensis TaxID=6313 RepID=A0A0K0DFL6_ANGCA